MNFPDFSRLLSATITRANLAIWEFSIAARTVLRKENIVLGIPTARHSLQCLSFRYCLTKSCRSLLSYWHQKRSPPSTHG